MTKNTKSRQMPICLRTQGKERRRRKIFSVSICVHVGNETSEEDLHLFLLLLVLVRMKNFFNWNQLHKICVEFEKTMQNERNVEEKTVNLSVHVGENAEEKMKAKLIINISHWMRKEREKSHKGNLLVTQQYFSLRFRSKATRKQFDCYQASSLMVDQEKEKKKKRRDLHNANWTLLINCNNQLILRIVFFLVKWRREKKKKRVPMIYNWWRSRRRRRRNDFAEFHIFSTFACWASMIEYED